MATNNKLLNSFILAIKNRAKLAGSQTTLSINRALNSKQYDLTIITLSQHINDDISHEHLPTKLPTTTLRSQTKGSDEY